MACGNIRRQLLPLVKPEPHLASQQQEIGKRNKQLVQCTYIHHHVSLAQISGKPNLRIMLDQEFHIHHSSSLVRMILVLTLSNSDKLGLQHVGNIKPSSCVPHVAKQASMTKELSPTIP